MLKNSRYYHLLALLPFLFVTCSSNKNYAAEVLNPAPKAYYTVQTGDTLSAISAKNNFSYLNLAKWNNISAPYHVKSGQKLKLFQDKLTKILISKKPISAKNHTKNPKIKTYKVKNGDTLYSIGRKFHVNHALLAKINNLPSANAVYTGQILKIFKHNQKNSHKNIPKKWGQKFKKTGFFSEKTSIISNNNENMLKFYCQLPLKGKIIKNFSQTNYRGIEIAGKFGQAVKAVAAGKVVSVNSVLYGYGKTIVIQHNAIYMSSYSNNNRALVTIGQKIKQGQIIAEVGRIGKKRPSVKFEMRKKGKLVNPMPFFVTKN